MKKNLIIATLILCCLSLLGYAQRAKIALLILPSALQQTFDRNTIEELGDGLHLALCGAGGPMPSATRSGPCVAVIGAGKLFLVDAGSNGVRNLARMGYPLGNIDGVFISHFHSDHIDGLGEIATLRWAAGSHTSPLPVYGPEGIDDVVNGFNAAYVRDAVYRNDHHGDMATPLSGAGMRAIGTPSPANGELRLVYAGDGLKVEMLRVTHAPIDPAVAYLFSYKGRTILISGDTNKSENLQKFAHNVDLLVHEALAPQFLVAMKNAALAANDPSRAKIFDDVLDYHTSPTEAAEIARDANVGHLLYYHVVPPLPAPGLEALWLEGVDDIFTEYTLGRDGTSISLPPDSKSIVHRGSDS